MKISDLWREMASEAPAVTAPWLLRHASERPDNLLMVGFEAATNRPALLLPSGAASIRKGDLPSCKGLELWVRAIGGKPFIGVTLASTDFSDVFAILAEDVKARLKNVAKPETAVALLLARLKCWKRFLAGGDEGLGLEAQRGLVGELLTLRDHLIPTLTPDAAIAAWVGPRGAHQDFEFGSSAVEVKTTVTKAADSVRITSERQLDTTGTDHLLLHVYVLDAREAGEWSLGAPPEGMIGTLPDVVAVLRARVRESPLAADALEQRLLEAGYRDAHQDKYERASYAIRKQMTYRIEDGFPAITPATVPTGLGNISYDLNLAACDAFAVDGLGGIARASR